MWSGQLYPKQRLSNAGFFHLFISRMGDSQEDLTWGLITRGGNYESHLCPLPMAKLSHTAPSELQGKLHNVLFIPSHEGEMEFVTTRSVCHEGETRFLCGVLDRVSSV